MRHSLLIKVIIAILLAVIAGLATGSSMSIFGVTFVQIYGLIGKLFLNALTLVVVPLVASSIITGAARMGKDGTFGTLGVKTLGFFLLTSFLAIMTGLTLAGIIEPGLAIKKYTGDFIPISENASPLPDTISAFEQLEKILLKLIPSNILAVAAEGQMLGLIFFSLLFGYFISKIEVHSASIMLGFWNGVFQIMMQITHLVMRALPIGVFGLVAKVVATSGLQSFSALGYFILTVFIGLAIHCFITLPLLLKFVGKVSPIAHFKAMGPALLTAFSTSSSAASLPITIECVEKRANVSNRICSFTVPLGTTLNLTGSTLHVCVAVLTIAQVYGLALTFPNILLIVLMTLITSFGMAGIPSASLVTILLIIHTLGLPAEGIGLILAVERGMDMFRTVVNVFGNSCCAVLVAHSEGETGILVPQATSSSS